MPLTTTESAELEGSHELIRAIIKLFTAISAHSSAVALIAQVAIGSTDPQAIRDVKRILDQMTETLREPEQPMMPPSTVAS